MIEAHLYPFTSNYQVSISVIEAHGSQSFIASLTSTISSLMSNERDARLSSNLAHGNYPPGFDVCSLKNCTEGELQSAIAPVMGDNGLQAISGGSSPRKNDISRQGTRDRSLQGMTVLLLQVLFACPEAILGNGRHNFAIFASMHCFSQEMASQELNILPDLTQKAITGLVIAISNDFLGRMILR